MYVLLLYKELKLLNQARAGRKPARACFFEIASVRETCVCPPPRLLITTGMIWCDMEPL